MAIKNIKEEIVQCKNILNEIHTLLEGILDLDINISQIKTILVGVKDLYQIKFEKLNRILHQEILDSELEQIMLCCWEVVDDLGIIYEYLNEEDIQQIDKENIANMLLGLEALYGVKFKKLEKYLHHLEVQSNSLQSIS
jgi:hypothetical protein